MTCAHCIDKRVMGDKNTIEILYDNGTKYIEINLDEREIHSFQNVHIDAVVFEILPKDNISKVYFLIRNLPENENISKNNINNLNDEINHVNKDEAISVHFMSSDQTINYAFPSYPNELFSIVVNKLIEKYPDYKNKPCHFICKAYYMKLNLTMKQNKYKSGDKIPYFTLLS